MLVVPIITPPVHANDDLLAILKAALPASLPERSVVVITSKIVALCEGAVAPKVTGAREEKHQLVAAESEFYLPASASKYDVSLAIKDSILAVSAGVDESNADNQYILLPVDSYASAAFVWNWLKDTYQVKEVGVLITDSKTVPLKWGTMGTALGYCGFQGLINKIGEKDLFGHHMQKTKVNVAEGLAAAAVVEMGEVAESTPLALITEAKQVVFMDQPLSASERAELLIKFEDDVYAPVLTATPWLKGGKNQAPLK